MHTYAQTYSISQERCTRFLLCWGYTLTDFPISIRLTSLALWQSNDFPSASKATLMNMDKYFMWIHYERLHNHNKAKHNKTVCIFLGIYCTQEKYHVRWLQHRKVACQWRANNKLQHHMFGGDIFYMMIRWYVGGNKMAHQPHQPAVI